MGKKITSHPFVGEVEKASPLGSQVDLSDAPLITSNSDTRLSNARILTDSTDVTWNRTISGTIKAFIVGLANFARVNASNAWSAAQTFTSIATSIGGSVFTDDGALAWIARRNNAFPAVKFDRTGTSATSHIVELIAGGALQFDGKVQVVDDVTLSKSGGDISVFVNGDAGRQRGLGFRSAGANRWYQSAESTAESGSDAGSDWQLLRYSDAAVSHVALKIKRSTGAVHIGDNATNEQGNPMLMVHGGTGSGGTGRTGSLQVDSANRNLNIGGWNHVRLWTNVGDEAAPTSGVLGIDIDTAGKVTVATAQLNVTGSQGIKFDTKDAGLFADATYIYVTDYATGLKGLRVNYGTGDMKNVDGNLVPGVVISGVAPTTQAYIQGTLWCQI